MYPHHGYYAENIPPNMGEDPYRTPQSIPSMKSKSSAFTSIRPSPRSLTSPATRPGQIKGTGFVATYSGRDFDVQSPREQSIMNQSASAQSDIADAFRAQVLAACAGASDFEGGLQDMRHNANFGAVEIPYMPPAEYVYNPYREQSSFQQLVEVPNGVSFAAEPVVNESYYSHHQPAVEPSDIGETFRQQVLAACTQVALESWLDDATPDRQWTPMDTRAVSPALLNDAVNAKLASAVPSPKVELAAVATEPVEETISEPVTDVQSEKSPVITAADLLDLPTLIPEKTPVVGSIELPEEPRAESENSPVTIREPLVELPPMETEKPAQQMSPRWADIAAAKSPVTFREPLIELPSLEAEKPVQQTSPRWADIAPAKSGFSSPRLAKAFSEIVEEPLSPVRDSVRLIEESSKSKRPVSPDQRVAEIAKSTPGSIRQVRRRQVADLQESTVPIINVTSPRLSEEGVQTEPVMENVVQECSEAIVHVDQENVSPKRLNVGLALSPEQKKQHSMIIEELKVRFSSRKNREEDSMFVHVNEPAIQSVESSILAPISLMDSGKLDMDFGVPPPERVWEHEEAEDENVAANAAGENEGGEKGVTLPIGEDFESVEQEHTAREELPAGHPSAASFNTDGSPPSLQPVLDPEERRTLSSSDQTPKPNKKKPFFCCC